MKRLGWLAATVVLLIVVTLVWVGVRFSGGEPYPAVVTEPRYPAQALEKVLEYPEPLGNLAVDDEGRVYFTVHPESRPSGHKVLVWDGEAFAPFPDAARQDSLFQAPLGMVIDRQGRVWTIDHGFHGLGDPRLLAAMRRQANFVEQVPIALLLLGIVELNGASATWLHALGATLLVSRVVHPFGLDAADMRRLPRLLGALGTLLMVLAAAATALWQVL